MADENERPAVPHSGVAIIHDADDATSPQNLEPLVALTPGQLEVLKERIRNHLLAIRARKDRTAFVRAASWVFKAFSYGVHMDSDFVPPPSYGATFVGFVDFIHLMEHTAEAEEMMDEDGDRP